MCDDNYLHLEYSITGFTQVCRTSENPVQDRLTSEISTSNNNDM